MSPLNNATLRALKARAQLLKPAFKVGKEGLEGLDEGQRAQVPADMDRDDQAYRERIKQVFDRHPQEEGKDFENFLLVQLLWDEGMSARAAT